MKKFQVIVSSLLFAFLSGCGDMTEQPKEATISPESAAALTLPAGQMAISEEPPIELLFTDDEEALALGDSCARSLQRLFNDYLCYDSGKFLKLRSTGERVESDIPDSDFYVDFFGMESDTIKTFDDLKSVFTEFCTENYALHLLHDTSFYYKDIDGRLYSSETELCFMGFKNAYLTDWEQRGENEIVFTLTAVSDDALGVDYSEYYSEGYVRDTSYDRTFTMTVVRQDGEWLIADCADPSTIGYVYRADTFGDRGEYGDEEARRIAEETAPKIKKAFLDYVQYDREKLALRTNGKQAVRENTYRKEAYTAIGMESDTVKTYEDLEAALSPFCDPYGLSALLNFSHQYMDIDGALYMIPSKGEFAEKYVTVQLIDWYRRGNTLVFVYYAEGGDPDSDPDERYVSFSVSEQNGKWLLHFCARPDVFGYCYGTTSRE